MWTGKVRFMDGSGNEVGVYNPSNISDDTVTYQISENEELIGIYGVKGKFHWFTSFGFILRVKDIV